MIASLAGFLRRNIFLIPSLPVHSLKQLLWGNGLVQLISLLAYPFLLIWYSAEAMGELGIVTSILAVFGTLAAGRYDRALILSQRAEERLALFWLGMLLSFLFCTAAFGAILILKEVKAALLPGILWDYRYLLVLGLGAYTVFQLQLSWLNQQERYRAISQLRVGQKITVLGLQFAAIWLLAEYSGLVVGMLGGLLLISLCGFIAYDGGYSLPSFSSLKQVAKKYRDFPRYNATQLIIELPLIRLLYFLLPLYYSLEVTGWYTLVMVVLTLPELVLGNGISQVFYQKLAQTPSDNRADLLRKTRKSLLKNAGFVYGGLFVAALLVYPLLEQSSWNGAPLFLLLLAPSAAIRFVSVPLSSAFTVFGKERINLIFAILSLFFKPLFFFAGYYFGTVYLAIGLFSLYEVIHFGIYLKVIQQHAAAAR